MSACAASCGVPALRSKRSKAARMPGGWSTCAAGHRDAATVRTGSRGRIPGRSRPRVPVGCREQRVVLGCRTIQSSASASSGTAAGVAVLAPGFAEEAAMSARDGSNMALRVQVCLRRRSGAAARRGRGAWRDSRRGRRSGSASTAAWAPCRRSGRAGSASGGNRRYCCGRIASAAARLRGVRPSRGPFDWRPEDVRRLR